MSMWPLLKIVTDGVGLISDSLKYTKSDYWTIGNFDILMSLCFILFGGGERVLKVQLALKSLFVLSH